MTSSSVCAEGVLREGPGRVRWAGVLSAYLRRDGVLAVSYRLPFVMGIVQSLLGLPFLYFLSRLVGRHIALTATNGNYFSFAVLGSSLLLVFSSTIVSVAQRMRTDQTTGTLEILFAMPLRPMVVVMASAAYQVCYALGAAAAGLMLAVALGMRFHVSAASLVLAVVALVAALVLFVAVGIVFAAYTLVFKRGETLTGLVTSGLTILGGVYYPVSLLHPAALRWLADALPFTWAITVLRSALLDAQTPLARLAQVIGSAVVGLGIASWLLSRALDHARRSGMLGQY
ncbi:MAG: ABC transporter permease [Acidimicrobiales bacterium]